MKTKNLAYATFHFLHLFFSRRPPRPRRHPGGGAGPAAGRGRRHRHGRPEGLLGQGGEEGGQLHPEAPHGQELPDRGQDEGVGRRRQEEGQGQVRSDGCFRFMFVCLLTGSCQAVATFSQVTGRKRLVQRFLS